MTLEDVLGTPLLIYGIGNVGRQDDGLGPLLVERLEDTRWPAGVTLEIGYQLAPEDALTLSAHEVVLFVDATTEPGARVPYSLAQVPPASEISFSSHAFSMGSLLTLCARLYGRAPRAYALAIPGYAFDVNASLSAKAAANLDHAVRDLRALLRARVGS